jgi:uncharacterized protein with ATP-grasp and redox domains
MKAFLECVPCITSQIIRILNKHEPDVAKRQAVLAKVLFYLSHENIVAHSAPSLTQGTHQILREHLGSQDLYIEDKAFCNREALVHFDAATALFDEADDKLEAASKLAIAGNLIDYGALSHFDVAHVIDDYVHRPFSVNHLEQLRAALSKPQNILFICDNSGEIVFDKILVKYLLANGHKVTIAVKSAPILNDALYEDAVAVGMTQLANVIPSGSDTAGTLLSQSTPEFRLALNKATLIISKGQGNFETLSEESFKQPLFYLLLCKCPHIAKGLDIEPFSLMLVDHRKMFG